jgi:hypothetical protein
VVDQKQLENVKYFNYLGSMITNDARCTWEIKSRTGMAKAAFNKALFTSKFDLNSRKKLVKCYTWSMVFYGAETWTLKVDQKYFASFEMSCSLKVLLLSLWKTAGATTASVPAQLFAVFMQVNTWICQLKPAAQLASLHTRIKLGMNL